MSKVRDCFRSRFDDGYLVEADYSQLEVIHLAHITQDPQLIDDILSGVDRHLESASQLFGKPKSKVTDKERKIAKAFSFMLQYGSGANNMAFQTGLPVTLAQQFIKNYYDRYPLVAEWQERNIDMLNKSAKPTGKHNKVTGDPIREAVLVSETGRRYVFNNDVKSSHRSNMKKATGSTRFHGKSPVNSLSPTEIKNYPIQGGATGDIVPMMLVQIHRWLLEDAGRFENAKLIATVHDSIVLDVTAEIVDNVCKEVKRIMEDAPRYYKSYFGVDYTLPLKADVKYGRSWGEIE